MPDYTAPQTRVTPLLREGPIIQVGAVMDFIIVEIFGAPLQSAPPTFGKIYFPAPLQGWLGDLIWPMECEKKWPKSFESESLESWHKLAHAFLLFCHDL